MRRATSSATVRVLPGLDLHRIIPRTSQAGPRALSIRGLRTEANDPKYARTLLCGSAFRISAPSTNRSHHMIFRKLAVHHITDVAWSGGGDDVLYTDNHVYDLGWPRSGYGWYSVGKRNVWRNNIVHDTVYGFHLRSLSELIQDSIIENNVVYDNGRGCYWHLGSAQVKCGGAGIYLAADGGGNIIRNNLIFENQRGVHTYPNGLKILNNTFYENVVMAIMAHSTNVVAKNNILYANGAAMVGAALDSSNLTADPRFVNAAAHDFHLQLGSPAIDKGVSLAEVKQDFEGTGRPKGAAFDIGAYEVPK